MEQLLDIQGFLYGLSFWQVLAVVLVPLLLIGYFGAPLWLWSLFFFTLLVGVAAPVWLLVFFAVVVVIFNLRALRLPLVSTPLMNLLKSLNILPAISETERVAIEAGNVWIEGDLFSGNPDFDKIFEEPYPELTEKERAFLDGPVETLCSMVSDWEVFRKKEFDKDVWDYLSRERFYGLIIPEEFGGHGFSANAHSAIIAKLASRCGPLATTVMVPNSLGPAELLMHYGTDKQKDHYLPRLATGEEMPCFALTEPQAGSDAGAVESNGVLFRGDDGELQIRLNWNKRYITLASISTIIGLAFRLRDPENLLGQGEELGITCALVPSDSDGVVLGKRHDPMGVPFHNCPTRGKDVVVPLDAVIGGANGAGNGWRMLMEALAVGRGISLPAQATGSAHVAARAIGAYTAVRKQFGLNIGKFEGIEEPMARIGGFNYIMEASRRFTCGALDKGAKPAVITAIAKYNSTELGRKIVNDAMDIVGGAGISRGPRNLFAHTYIATPIGITVEGANILTRSLIIFGQGAIRCHPYAYRVIKALMSGDSREFDDALWNHIGHVVRNGFRSTLLSLSRGFIAHKPAGLNRISARYVQKLTWMSASFAFMADIALGSYGGALKMKEKIAGRYADILGWMYLSTAALRRYINDGQRKEDDIYLEWALEYGLFQIQQSFEAIYQEIRVPGLSWLFRGPVALWARINRVATFPSDECGHLVAQAMQQPGEQRDRMSEGIYIPTSRDETLGRYDYALDRVIGSWPIYKKLYQATKAGEIRKGTPGEQLDEAVEKGLITPDDAEQVKQTEEARLDAVLVDEYTLEEYNNDLPKAPAGDGLSLEEGKSWNL